MSPDEARALPVVVPLWPAVGSAFGLCRATTYELAKRDALPVPVLRVGSRYRVRRADLLAALGMSDEVAA